MMNIIQAVSLLSFIPIANIAAPIVYVLYLFRHKPLSKGEELFKSALVATGFLLPLVLAGAILSQNVFVGNAAAGQLWLYLCLVTFTQGLIFRMRRSKDRTAEDDKDPLMQGHTITVLTFSKTFLFYALLLLSCISFINIVTLYWDPVYCPFSSHLTTGLMFMAYAFKMYYLIPLAVLSCILLLCAAIAVRMKKTVVPLTAFGYLLTELCFLAPVFLSHWFQDGYFSGTQAMQILMRVSEITFLCIYFVHLRKEKRSKNMVM